VPQEDAHEFLRLLIDAMQRSYPPPRPGSGPSSAPFAHGPALRNEYPFALFRGALQSTVTCGGCGARSHSHDPIEDLGLELSAATATVEDALRLHTRTEQLNGDNCFECARCEALVRAERTIALHDVPALLIVQLKRFVYTSTSAFGPSKVGTHVRFGQTLHLDDFLSPETTKAARDARQAGAQRGADSPQKVPPSSGQGQGVGPGPGPGPGGGSSAGGKLSSAQLVAVVVHQGNTVYSGHYYSYVRGQKAADGTFPWYRMNDSIVTPVDFEVGAFVHAALHV
jgi:ubiquitin carboxyl-terminal hydrolase 36/42